jgi:hypothetical protein
VPCEDSVDSIEFDLSQEIAVVPAGPTPRAVKLILEGQLAGLFRGSREGAGAAAISPAVADLVAGTVPVAHLEFPGRSHAGKELVLVNDRFPAAGGIVAPGDLCLTQKFGIRCDHPKRCFHKNVMTAAFGSETGRAPEWLSLLDPTRDIPKQRDFGFRVTLRAEPMP